MATIAYRYVLDVEMSEGKFEEAIGIARRIVEEFRKLGATLELLIPQTGNVHSVLAIFHFDTLSQYEELMQRASGVEELMKMEQQFHCLMKRPVYNLYSTLD